MAPAAKNFHVRRSLSAKRFVVLVVQLQLLVGAMKCATLAAVASAEELPVSKA
jgi:hypothetical protein